MELLNHIRDAVAKDTTLFLSTTCREHSCASESQQEQSTLEDAIHNLLRVNVHGELGLGDFNIPLPALFRLLTIRGLKVCSECRAIEIKDVLEKKRKGRKRKAHESENGSCSGCIDHDEPSSSSLEAQSDRESHSNNLDGKVKNSVDVNPFAAFSSIIASHSSRYSASSSDSILHGLFVHKNMLCVRLCRPKLFAIVSDTINRYGCRFGFSAPFSLCSMTEQASSSIPTPGSTSSTSCSTSTPLLCPPLPLRHPPPPSSQRCSVASFEATLTSHDHSPEHDMMKIIVVPSFTIKMAFACLTSSCLTPECLSLTDLRIQYISGHAAKILESQGLHVTKIVSTPITDATSSAAPTSPDTLSGSYLSQTLASARRLLPASVKPSDSDLDGLVDKLRMHPNFNIDSSYFDVSAFVSSSYLSTARRFGAFPSLRFTTLNDKDDILLQLFLVSKYLINYNKIIVCLSDDDAKTRSLFLAAEAILGASTLPQTPFGTRVTFVSCACVRACDSLSSADLVRL